MCGPLALGSGIWGIESIVSVGPCTPEYFNDENCEHTVDGRNPAPVGDFWEL